MAAKKRFIAESVAFPAAASITLQGYDAQKGSHWRSGEPLLAEHRGYLGVAAAEGAEHVERGP